uniref:Reticulon-like protein n=1 Tax=Ciona savignyi TaxID=51511 RepID=H2Z0Y0_CIOSA
MEYETSPTIKFENAGDVGNDEEKSEKSSASDGSEGFVKVDQELDDHEDPALAKQTEPIKPPVSSFVSEVKPEPKTELSVLQNINPKVKDLLYWKDVKVSGVVFGLLLLVLLSLNCFSVVSVVAYFTLSMLAVTITFRLYKLVLQTLNGTQQPNPFQSLLDMEIALSSEQVHKYTDAALDHVNCTLVSTRDLLLVKNTVASLKFGVFMWLLTYIGCCFNGLTILILGVVAAFSIPPVYQKYQVPIDNHYNMAAQKVAQATNTIRSKIPGAKPKTQ